MSDIEKFIEAIKNDRFVEGHEVLESRWKKLKTDTKYLDESKILKGLINGSTAIALKMRGKDSGAQRVWSTFEKYKPLIDTVPSRLNQKYKEARDILEEKRRLYM